MTHHDTIEIIPITHYGLHTSNEGITFLHQGTRNAPNFVGLKKFTPFATKPDGAKMCPHSISLSHPIPDRLHWEFFCKIYHDPLVQEMLPVPKGRFAYVPYLNDPHNDMALALTLLSKLSSPVVQVVHPIDSLREIGILKLLALTNVAPLVLTGVKPEHQGMIERITKEARLMPRRLILTGDQNVVIREPMVRIKTHLWSLDDLEIAHLPMEQIGVSVLKRTIRGERVDVPFERKD